MADNIYINELDGIAKDDVAALRQAEKSYGNSWKKRGGVGAFMMLARKWDRMEKHLTDPDRGFSGKYDILEAAAKDNRPEGLIDDIRDLRRYLMLVEAELRASGRCPGKLAKDIEDGCASKGSTGRDLTNVMTATEFLIRVDDLCYVMNPRIGMNLVKYVKEKLGESVLSEVKIENGIPLNTPIPSHEKYKDFIKGLAIKVKEAYSNGHLLLILEGFRSSLEADDTPSASVLHDG